LQPQGNSIDFAIKLGVRDPPSAGVTPHHLRRKIFKSVNFSDGGQFVSSKLFELNCFGPVNSLRKLTSGAFLFFIFVSFSELVRWPVGSGIDRVQKEAPPIPHKPFNAGGPLTSQRQHLLLCLATTAGPF
jgi:hypothetical protein